MMLCQYSEVGLTEILYSNYCGTTNSRLITEEDFTHLLPKISPLLAYSVTKYSILSVSITCRKTRKNKSVNQQPRPNIPHYITHDCSQWHLSPPISRTPPPPLHHPTVLARVSVQAYSSLMPLVDSLGMVNSYN